MLANERIQDYCKGKHLCKLNRAQVSENSTGVQQDWKPVKTSCVETKVSSGSMDFSDLMGKINCRLLHGWPRMEREREVDWSSNNFTESEGSVVYRRKNWFLRLQQILRSFVFIYTDFQINVRYRTLCFSVEFSFSPYPIIILYIVSKSLLL